MTTHSNYSLQNFSTNNARVLTGNSQPVSEITYTILAYLSVLFSLPFAYTLSANESLTPQIQKIDRDIYFLVI